MPSGADLSTLDNKIAYTTRLKNAGNELFGQGKYQEAEQVYSTVLSVVSDFACETPGTAAGDEETALRPLVEAALANRAQCSLSQDMYDAAFSSCEELLKLNPDHPKGLYRKGMAAAKMSGKRALNIAEECAVKLQTLSLALAPSSLDPAKLPISYHEESTALLNFIQAQREKMAVAESTVLCVRLSPGPHPCKITEAVLPASSSLLCGVSYPCPLLQAVGLPYRIARVLPVPGDNKFATIVMADIASGLAPLEWQRNVGEVLLFRTDGERTSATHAWALWDFIYTAMDYYGAEDPVAVQNFLTRESFSEFMVERKQFLLW